MLRSQQSSAIENKASTSRKDRTGASVAERSRQREAHPIFGMLRLATSDVWAARRRALGQLGVRELDFLHAEVARCVAAQIRARHRP